MLGIGLIVAYFGSLDYATVFAAAPQAAGATINLVGDRQWSLLTAICIGLFVGAMGKSAQVPLHVWLPDSMEGPTPISALIHAATMVTAGIFMVARMSPLFELSDTALSFVTIIGATTALFMAILGIVQNDIKRVVAYSTLSQLGYMTVALGVSAYSAAIFHLMTHAFFKALLFLGRGLGDHRAASRAGHAQDGRLAEVHADHLLDDGDRLAGACRHPAVRRLLLQGRDHRGGAAVDGARPHLRAVRGDARRVRDRVLHLPHAVHDVPRRGALPASALRPTLPTRSRGTTTHAAPTGPPQESPWVVTVPLILLAIPSVYAGWAYVEPVLFGDFFGSSIVIAPQHAGWRRCARSGTASARSSRTASPAPPFWLALAGIAPAWLLYIRRPDLPAQIQARTEALYTLLANNYYFDRFNDWFFAGGFRRAGRLFSDVGDRSIIDGFFVNGSARVVGAASAALRQIQSGYIYHYAFTMIIGVFSRCSGGSR